MRKNEIFDFFNWQRNEMIFFKQDGVDFCSNLANKSGESEKIFDFFNGRRNEIVFFSKRCGADVCSNVADFCFFKQMRKNEIFATGGER